jgi:hypothetical protein
LAKDHHPDQGGDAGAMQRVNEAAAAALRIIEGQRPAPDASPPAPPASPASSGSPAPTGARPDPPPSQAPRGRFATDMPSFTVEALPAETFEALVVVSSWLGEILDDDPPYRLDTYLRAPFDCWCGLEVVPDAGGSTVSLAIAGVDGATTPDVLDVRDAWIAGLNAVDWP